MDHDTDALLVSLPSSAWAEALGEVDGVQVQVWDGATPLPSPPPHVVVPPYVVSPDLSALSEAVGVRVVQLMTNGFDGVLDQLPEHVTVCNAAGVHDASTAELAVGLALASLRGLDDAARAMPHGDWTARRRTSLADRHVLVIGWGGVGRAVARRLAGFEVSLTAVGSRARTEDGVDVHGPDELPALLPAHDVVVLACPLDENTRGMVDAAFLAALPDGALVVNVARGPVVDSDALLAELRAGRLHAALDVTDPEPLPADHPLWTAPGCLVSPHVGGNTSAFQPRFVRLLRAQLELLVGGSDPGNVVRAGV